MFCLFFFLIRSKTTIWIIKTITTNSRIGRQPVCPESVKAVIPKSLLLMNKTGHVEITVCILDHSVNLQNWYASFLRSRSLIQTQNRASRCHFAVILELYFGEHREEELRASDFLEPNLCKHLEELLTLLQHLASWKTTQTRHLINLNYSCWYKNLICTSVRSEPLQPCKGRIRCSQPLKKIFINLL